MVADAVISAGDGVACRIALQGTVAVAVVLVHGFQPTRIDTARDIAFGVVEEAAYLTNTAYRWSGHFGELALIIKMIGGDKTKLIFYGGGFGVRRIGKLGNAAPPIGNAGNAVCAVHQRIAESGGGAVALADTRNAVAGIVVGVIDGVALAVGQAFNLGR